MIWLLVALETEIGEQRFENLMKSSHESMESWLSNFPKIPMRKTNDFVRSDVGSKDVAASFVQKEQFSKTKNFIIFSREQATL